MNQGTAAKSSPIFNSKCPIAFEELSTCFYLSMFSISKKTQIKQIQVSFGFSLSGVARGFQ
jgi:hypothetical protein